MTHVDKNLFRCYLCFTILLNRCNWAWSAFIFYGTIRHDNIGALLKPWLNRAIAIPGRNLRIHHRFTITTMCHTHRMPELMKCYRLKIKGIGRWVLSAKMKIQCIHKNDIYFLDPCKPTISIFNHTSPGSCPTKRPGLTIRLKGNQVDSIRIQAVGRIQRLPYAKGYTSLTFQLIQSTR